MKIANVAAQVTVFLFAATAHAEPNAVVLSPVEGISLSVPSGFNACDEASDKAIEGPPVTASRRADACDRLKANYPGLVLGAFDKWAKFLVTRMDAVPVPAEAIASFDDKALAELSDTIKKEQQAQFAKTGGTVEKLVVSVAKLDDQIALVTTATMHAPGNPLAVMREDWAVPYKDHTYTISFVWPAMFEKTVKPRFDAIKASVKFD